MILHLLSRNSQYIFRHAFAGIMNGQDAIRQLTNGRLKSEMGREEEGRTGGNEKEI